MDIIPDSTQLNLYKSKLSASNSYKDLFQSFGQEKYKDVDEDSKAELIKASFSVAANLSQILSRDLGKKSLQESLNLFSLSPSEAWKFLRNSNNLPTNSKEHLIYKFKQGMNEVNIDF